MWAEGHSASQIGLVLGVTRNAVIGVAHRRKWVKHLTPHATGPKPRKPRPSRAGNPFNRPKTPRTPPTVKAVLPVTMPPTLATAWKLPLTVLYPGDCRWPVGDDTGCKQLFCARPAEFDSSYCPAHRLMSVGAGTYSERRAV
jgi:GcrA cell cycle regulator